MSHRISAWPIAAGVIAVTGSLLALQPGALAQDAGVEVRKDVTYFEGPAAEAKKHQLDLYLPKDRRGFPLMLFIHGGAWKTGSKDIYLFLGRAFATRGIGVAVANYRLSPGVKHPEHIKDVARAFAWVA